MAGAAESQPAVPRRLHCARPPFALERLEATGYGTTGGERIVYRLPHPAPGGGTALSLTDFRFDQSSGFNPADPEPVPEYEFDQSLPD